MKRANFEIGNVSSVDFDDRLNFPNRDSPSRVYIMKPCLFNFSDDIGKISEYLEGMFDNPVFSDSDFNLGFLWWSKSRDSAMCDFNGYSYSEKWAGTPTRYSWVMNGDCVRENGSESRIETGCGIADKVVGIEQFYRDCVNFDEYVKTPPINPSLLSFDFDVEI